MVALGGMKHSDLSCNEERIDPDSRSTRGKTESSVLVDMLGYDENCASCVVSFCSKEFQGCIALSVVA